MRVPVRLLPVLPALCLAACAGSGGDDSSSQMAMESMSPDPVESKRVKTGDWTDNDEDKIKSKYGAVNTGLSKDGKIVASGKEYEGFRRDNPEFKGRWDNKAGDIRKKSWWGDRDYVKKVYGGNTDANSLRKDSRFDDRSAGESSVTARDAKKSYRTGDYATTSAREGSRKGITKTTDAETDERRRVFTSPDIIPWKAQSGMTVNDTKRMLGR